MAKDIIRYPRLNFFPKYFNDVQIFSVGRNNMDGRESFLCMVIINDL